jgi:predicted small secreted protein
MMLKKLTLMLMIASGALLVACNTVKGVGKDVESAGEAVQNTAN